MTSGYTLNGSGEKRFFSDYQKRNLLLSYLSPTFFPDTTPDSISVIGIFNPSLGYFGYL
jgi:hypothetical protein